jgi:hypothetical protein
MFKYNNNTNKLLEFDIKNVKNCTIILTGWKHT